MKITQRPADGARPEFLSHQFDVVMTGEELVRLHKLSFHNEASSKDPGHSNGMEDQGEPARFHKSVEQALKLGPTDLRAVFHQFYRGHYKG